MRASIQTWCLPLLAAPLVVALSGCTIRYNYELSCIVRSASDGTPLPGVTAIVDTFGNKEQPTFGQPMGPPSDVDGRLAHTFSATLGAFDPGQPRWYLKLHKAGYIPEVVDIKPTMKPEKAGVPTPMFVLVYMRPSDQHP